MSQKVMDEIENLGYPIEEQQGEDEQPGINIGTIIMFIPFVNIAFVIYGCIRSDKIIKMSVKQILGDDYDEDEDDKNDKNSKQ